MSDGTCLLQLKLGELQNDCAIGQPVSKVGARHEHRLAVRDNALNMKDAGFAAPITGAVLRRPVVAAGNFADARAQGAQAVKLALSIEAD